LLALLILCCVLQHMGVLVCQDKFPGGNLEN